MAFFAVSVVFIDGLVKPCSINPRLCRKLVKGIGNKNALVAGCYGLGELAVDVVYCIRPEDDILVMGSLFLEAFLCVVIKDNVAPFRILSRKGMGRSQVVI